jgi:hypothetical protein
MLPTTVCASLLAAVASGLLIDSMPYAFNAASSFSSDTLAIAVALSLMA